MIVASEAVGMLHEIEVSHDTILAQMQVFAKTLPEYYIVKSMPCIGDTLASHIIAEIGDVMQRLIQHKPVGDPVYDFIQKYALKVNAARKP